MMSPLKHFKIVNELKHHEELTLNLALQEQNFKICKITTQNKMKHNQKKKG